jgi:hypothetical protein
MNPMVERPPSGHGDARSPRDHLIVDRYIEGVPVAQIADEASVCRKTVRNVARRAGVPPRMPSQPERDAQALALYQGGTPVHKIATDLGICASLARQGVVPRKTSTLALGEGAAQQAALEQVAAKSTENARPALRSGQWQAMVSSRKETRQWQE